MKPLFYCPHFAEEWSNGGWRCYFLASRVALDVNLIVSSVELLHSVLSREAFLLFLSQAGPVLTFWEVPADKLSCSCHS